MCNKNLVEENNKKYEVFIEEDMRKMKDDSCEELYKTYLTSYGAFAMEASKRLLLERGHPEVFE